MQSSDLPERCGYCSHVPGQWNQTPQGRPSCPECGAIPADWQGLFDEDVVA